MAQFEAEIKNSIGQLQSTVAKLTAETERANTSMRGLSASTRAVATDVDRVGVSGNKSMKEIARGATVAGAGFGGITSALASLNPMFLVTGAAVGGVVAGVHELVSELINASAKAEELAAGIGRVKAAARQADVGAALGLDVQKERAAAFAGAAEELPPDIAAAVSRAQQIGVPRDEAIKRATEAKANRRESGLFGNVPLSGDQLAGAAAGFGGESDDFLRRERSVIRSPQEAVRREAERLQAVKADLELYSTQNAAARGVGFAAGGRSSDSAANLDPATKAHLDALTQALTDAIKAANQGGIQFAPAAASRAEDVESRRAELENFRAQLLESSK